MLGRGMRRPAGAVVKCVAVIAAAVTALAVALSAGGAAAASAISTVTTHVPAEAGDAPAWALTVSKAELHREELRLAELVRAAADVREALEGNGGSDDGLELSVGYLAGAGVRIGVEFAVASLAGMVSRQALRAPGAVRSGAGVQRIWLEADAGSHVLELLSQAARFSEQGDWRSSAACRAQAASRLGRSPAESYALAVSGRDLATVIAAVEAVPVEQLIVAWAGNPGEEGAGGGRTILGKEAPGWLSAVADGVIRVDLAWPSAEPRPQVGVMLTVRLGGSARPNRDLVEAAEAAVREMELAGLLAQFDLASYACPLHAGDLNACEAVVLARAAAALKVLAGMGIGLEAPGAEL